MATSLSIMDKCIAKYVWEATRNSSVLCRIKALRGRIFLKYDNIDLKDAGGSLSRYVPRKRLWRQRQISQKSLCLLVFLAQCGRSH